jgi:hypothetical protein
MRQLKGSIEAWGSAYARTYWKNETGILYPLGIENSLDLDGIGTFPHEKGFGIDTARQVTTGPDNAPVNASVRIWRRTG